MSSPHADLRVENLRILHYPAQVLRQRAEPVPDPTQAADLARRMIDLMHEAAGIGLAAPQVGVPLRLFVVDVPRIHEEASDPPEHTEAPTVYINPTLSAPGPDIEACSEGCLSLPEITGDVLRATRISITAFDIEGNRFTQTGAGLLARCWQHEYDHLDGVLILDRMIEPHKRRNRLLVRELEDRAHTV